MTSPAATADARALVTARLGLGVRRGDLEGALSECGDPARLAVLPLEGAEWQRLIARLTVSESYFFRDRGTQAVLERDVLPALIAERRASGDLRLRIWSAGCARGEEPYSLAILLHRLLPDRADWALSILGTDIDARSLEAARSGVYAAWSLRDAPDSERSRWFRPLPRRKFELDPAVREMVTFAPLNLAQDAYPAGVDLLVCRNVLMYFDERARRGALERLQAALAPGGWLVLGPAEATGEQLRPLVPVAFPEAVLHRRARIEDAPAAPEPVPVAPRVRVQDSGALARQARAHADGGRLDEALALCERALRRDALNPELHVLAAAIHQERGSLDQALAACRSAVYLAPDSPMARLLLEAAEARRESAR